MQKNGAGYVWEIAVPSGEYIVQIVAGDAGYADSIYRINVEGLLVVYGTPPAACRVTGTANVTVRDGKLTIENAPGAVNNKIDFVDITSIGPATEPNYQFRIYLPGILH